MFQFLRLSTKVLAVLRLSVNPIETLKQKYTSMEMVCANGKMAPLT